jgi:hypothetical protein
MIADWVGLYEKGAITAHHLAVESLRVLDPQGPGAVLGDLPAEVLEEILEFARGYQAGRMVTNDGVPPTPEQVRAASNWIARLGKTVGQGE